ncbi:MULTISPECIES: hypothetical protein [unclassified Streptomyces]|uniref:hypothetical protein n=1 Tax=unclassified Streptomyces TaxID=2593676 RepID=UPI002DDAFA3B|nr:MULTISPECIES: hypothetical protein [unclassified Streptomyces]WSA92149.1 hypothetical protein OIE63_11660 [Streptomyces sp. NBC_01795]WSB76514.1 hypothetical protein OHB04_12450 [Streptomyces sp. NBC_01775]WSS15197.1 hypothetical protein OG533_27400 [Streptomyces sp. NBC_01186]WSS44039.1 hypothetical protein OG220_28205 [Streptomyces sp. NBC_01187]
MKSTLTMHNIANPRRTTLAHLKDADELTTEAVAAHEATEAREYTGLQETGADVELPARTANPRRTVLVDAPAD